MMNETSVDEQGNNFIFEMQMIDKFIIVPRSNLPTFMCYLYHKKVALRHLTPNILSNYLKVEKLILNQRQVQLQFL